MKYTLSVILASLPIITFVVGQDTATTSGSAPSFTSAAASSSTITIGLSSTDSSSSSAYPSSLSSSISTFAPTALSSTVYVAASTSSYVSSSSVAPVPLPSISPIGNYYFAGCYVEPTGGRILSTLRVAADNMTLEACSASCAGQYQYFGLEFGRECWCGYTIPTGTIKATQDQCNMPCGGSSTEMCGAAGLLSLYSSTRLIPAPPAPPAPPPAPPAAPIPSAVPSVGPFNSLGCYTEPPNYERALTGLAVANANMTNELCATSCAGYRYFGTEYATECYCGDYLAVGAVSTASSDCFMNCGGNPLEACGGPLRLNLYFNPSAPTPSPLPAPVVPSTSSSVIATSSSSINPIPSSSSLTVSSSTTLIGSTISSSSIMSSTSSAHIGFSTSVIKSSSSSSVQASITSSAPKLTSTSSVPKSTTSSKLSSSSLKTTIASTFAKTTSSSTTTKSTLLTRASSTSKLPIQTPTWKSVGCFQDTAKHNMVAITKAKTMNVEACISAAAAAATAKKPVHYAFIGLENGSSCFGATVAPTATKLVGVSACTMTCAGNVKAGTKEMCGGKLQYNMYASV